MKTTLRALVSANDGLRALSTLTLPVKLSYRVTKLARQVLQEVEPFETARFALIKQLGAPSDPAANQWTVTPEHMEEFQAKVKELLDVEVEGPWAPIPLADLEAAGVAVAPMALLQLGPFLEEA